MNEQSFDLIGLSDLRNAPRYRDIDGQYRNSQENSQIRVAVIDTGINANHPSLQGNFVGYVDFVDDEFNNGQRVFHEDPINSEDSGSHGTHVAGTIGATDPNIGVAPETELIGLRVLGQNQRGGDLEEALQWVLDNRSTHNISAVNMSLGFPSAFLQNESDVESNPQFNRIQNLITQLENAGITVISAAGNNYVANHDDPDDPDDPDDRGLQENVSSPGFSSTLTVGAVWQDGINNNVQWGSGSTDFATGSDRITSFSQRLDFDKMIFAPGAIITSTVPGGELSGKGGTSMASPVVAGAVALLQDAALTFSNGSHRLTPAEIRDIIRSTADSIIDGDDESTNVEPSNNEYLRLNIFEAVREVERRLGRGNDPTDPPDSPPSSDNDDIIANAVDLGSLTSSLSFDSGVVGRDGDSDRGDADVDVFGFEVAGTGGLVNISTASRNATTVDTILRLFDVDGNEITFNDDGNLGDPFYSEISVDLSAGQYYVGVSGFSNFDYNPNQIDTGVPGATGDYSLEFSIENNDSSSSPDPNGTISGAFNAGSLSDYGPLGVGIGIDIGTDAVENGTRISVGNADIDLLEFSVSETGIAIFETNDTFPVDNNGNENPNFPASTYDRDNDGLIDFERTVDSILRLFDSEGNELAVNDDGGAGLFSRIEQSLDPGTYYLGISGYSNFDYDPNSIDESRIDGSTGIANLDISFQAEDSDNVDLNGVRRSAEVVNLGVGGETIFYGDIGFDDGIEVNDADVDLYEFTAEGDGVLLLDIDTPPFVSEENADTIIRLFDEEGNEIGFSDDDLAQNFLANPVEFDTNEILSDNSIVTDAQDFEVGHDLDSFLRADVVAGETYYIGVSGFGNAFYNIDNFENRESTNTGGFYDLIVSYSGASAALDIDGVINPSAEAISSSTQTPIIGSIGRDNPAGDLNEIDNDVDFYRINIGDTSSRLASFSVNAFNAELADPVDSMLFLFDAEGNEIAFNDDDSSLDPALQYTLQPDRDYFLAVAGYGNFDFNPFIPSSGSAGSTGNYELNIELPNTSNDSPNVDSRVRLPAFLSNSATDSSLDLDLDVFDITGGDVFSDRPDGLTIYELGANNEPVTIYSNLGRDVNEDIDELESEEERRTALRNSFGPIFLSASGLTENTASVGGVGSDDVDIFPVTITESGVYDLQSLNTSVELGELGANPVLVLYNEQGEEITRSQPGENVTAGVNTRIIRELDAGNYFLVVLPEGEGSNEYSFNDRRFNFPGDSTEERLGEFAANTGDYSLRLERFNLSTNSNSNSNDGSFAAAFNAEIDQEPLALYDGPDDGGIDRPSVSVTDAEGNSVRGSLVFDDNTQQFVFVPSDPFSINGSYTITYSGSDFATTFGQGLGEDVENEITVTRDPDAPIVAINSFARGPGQDVDIDGTGIPVIISDATDLQAIRLRIEYDPELLNITDAVIDPDLGGDWAIDGTPQIADGEVVVDLVGTTSLNGETQLINLIASVPEEESIFNESQVIRVSGGATNINGGSVIVEESTAVHKVAFLGNPDTSNETIDVFDALLFARLGANLDTGIDSADLVDPNLVGDLDQDGSVGVFDALLAARIGAGLDINENIPAINGELGDFTNPAIIGPDPNLKVSDVNANAGGQVTVTVGITDDAQGTGAFTLDLVYDTNALDISNTDITLGTDLTGFSPTINVDDPNGRVTINAFNATGNLTGTPELVNFEFTVLNEATGTIDLNLENAELRTATNTVLPTTVESGSITIAPPNLPPTAVELQNTVTSIEENSDTTERIKVADIAIDDDGNGTNNISLSGADAASFEVDGTELFLVAGTNLDFETKDSYNVTITVDDPAVGETPDATVNFTLNVNDINDDFTPLKLTGETVQIAYAAYYGRPADNNGLDFWQNELTENEVSYAPRDGDRLTGNEQNVYEQIINDFGTSEEAERLFGVIDNNRDKINQVYQFAFDRDAEEGGLDYWTEQIDLGHITLANFALEIALGAQNNDIIVLNNKIDSADLFSNSIDTEAEITAYSGSSGETFGREWLNNFKERVSSQAEVDEAIADLIAQD